MAAGQSGAQYAAYSGPYAAAPTAAPGAPGAQGDPYAFQQYEQYAPQYPDHQQYQASSFLGYNPGHIGIGAYHQQHLVAEAPRPPHRSQSRGGMPPQSGSAPKKAGAAVTAIANAMDLHTFCAQSRYSLDVTFDMKGPDNKPIITATVHINAVNFIVTHARFIR